MKETRLSLVCFGDDQGVSQVQHFPISALVGVHPKRGFRADRHWDGERHGAGSCCSRGQESMPALFVGRYQWFYL